MAEKNTTTFESIMQNLQNAVYAPVYILMGEESYYIDKIADYIADHALTAEEKDFNQTIVFGADVTGNQIVDMARRFPVMAERQVIIVKEAQNIKQWDRIEKYVEKPAPMAASTDARRYCPRLPPQASCLKARRNVTQNCHFSLNITSRPTHRPPSSPRPHR